MWPRPHSIRALAPSPRLHFLFSLLFQFPSSVLSRLLSILFSLLFFYLPRSPQILPHPNRETACVPSDGRHQGCSCLLYLSFLLSPVRPVFSFPHPFISSFFHHSDPVGQPENAYFSPPVLSKQFEFPRLSLKSHIPRVPASFSPPFLGPIPSFEANPSNDRLVVTSRSGIRKDWCSIFSLLNGLSASTDEQLLFTWMIPGRRTPILKAISCTPSTLRCHLFSPSRLLICTHSLCMLWSLLSQCFAVLADSYAHYLVTVTVHDKVTFPISNLCIQITYYTSLVTERKTFFKILKHLKYKTCMKNYRE